MSLPACRQAGTAELSRNVLSITTIIKFLVRISITAGTCQNVTYLINEIKKPYHHVYSCKSTNKNERRESRENIGRSLRNSVERTCQTESC